MFCIFRPAFLQFTFHYICTVAMRNIKNIQAVSTSQICTVAMRNIKNIQAVSTSQIVVILNIDDK